MRPSPPRLLPVLALVPLFLLPAACSAKEAEATGPQVDVSAAIASIATTRDKDTARLQAAYARIKKYPSKETLPLVVKELDSTEGGRRRAAIHALGMLVWEDPKPALAPLAKLLSNEDQFTRGPAAMTLASLGDTSAYDKILSMVKGDKEAYARRSAAWALGELGDERAIDELKALQDADEEVQLFIEDAIHRLSFMKDHAADEGETLIAARAVDRIAGSTKDQAERLDRALESLRKLEPEATKKLLTTWKAGKNRPKLASAAEWALQNLTPK